MSLVIRRALIMYARPPVLGQVKTRLQPSFSAADSLALYEAMLADGVERLNRAASGLATPFISWSGEVSLARELETLLPPAQIEFQIGDDLGERMTATLQSKLRGGYKQVVLIGSDAPNLPLDYIDQAFEALTAVDLVVGPADDGGYYLLGARRLHPQLFQRMPWGTERVLSITRERIKSGRVSHHELPRWYDVDTAESVARLWSDLQHMKAKGSKELPRRTFELLASMAGGRKP